MASCVVSLWMRASIKCGTPSNTIAASEVRARGNHDARYDSPSRRHAVEKFSRNCAHPCASFRQSRDNDDDVNSPMVQGSTAMFQWVRDIR
jgi:hypothetical protein